MEQEKNQVNVHPLFYTPLFQINVPEGLLNLESLKQYEFHSIEGGGYNCFNSVGKSVLEDFPLEKNFLCDTFNQVKNNLLRHESTRFAMTRSWVTKVEKEAVGQWHRHGNNYYTGVFYFDDYDDNSAPIEFESPLRYHRSFALDVTEFNANNTLSYSFSFPKNTLILFPAYLMHRIGWHKSDSPRYSLAFNFHPCGEYGIGDSKIYSDEIK